MMKATPVLLLSLFLIYMSVTAQGLRLLGRQPSDASPEKALQVEIGCVTAVEQTSAGMDETREGSAITAAVACKGKVEKCTGRSRRLLKKTIAMEGLKVSTPSPQPPQPAKPTRPAGNLPDVMDLAGMDYSPAKRKPPIHN